MSNQPYLQVEDKHGAIASILIHGDNNHKVKYQDDQGHMFFTETFRDVSIEDIEQSVMEWASGKRSLADAVSG